MDKNNQGPWRNQQPGEQSSHELGRRGEDLACNFLKAEGFTIIERNWRKRQGEIDIIALKDDAIHFIEVKSRYRYERPRSSAKGAIDHRKKKQLEMMAERYLQENRNIASELNLKACRLDVITIKYYEDRAPSIRFIERAISY